MSPLVRTLIFTIFIPGFWTILMPYWMLPKGTKPDLRGAGTLGWVLIAAGIVLYIACAFWGFAIRGKGTPLPLDPPKKLVVEGPYRVVRNPMYWGVGSVILGEAAVFHSFALAELAAAFGCRGCGQSKWAKARDESALASVDVNRCDAIRRKRNRQR